MLGETVLGPAAGGGRAAEARARAGAAWLDARPGVALGLSVTAAAILLAGMAFLVAQAPDPGGRLAIDFREYTEAASRRLAGGSFYQPWQLTGEYVVPQGEYRIDRLPVLYPPYTLLVFVPFAVLPVLAPLWWAIPLAIVLRFVASVRPRPWTWPVLALCACHGDTIWLTLSGNPALWVAAAASLGIRAGWPSIGVLLKPSLAPLALIGVQRLSWWIALGALVAVSFVVGDLWSDYLAVIRNIRGVEFGYPFVNLPLLLIPIVAWLGRRPVSSPA